MSTVWELIENLRNIISGFVKPKDKMLPFDGIRLPSREIGARDKKKESPISKKEALDRANDFICKVQRMFNSKNEDNNGTTSIIQ